MKRAGRSVEKKIGRALSEFYQCSSFVSQCSKSAVTLRSKFASAIVEKLTIAYIGNCADQRLGSDARWVPVQAPRRRRSKRRSSSS